MDSPKAATIVWRITQDQNGFFRYQIGRKGEKMENSPGYRTWDEAMQSVQAEIEQYLDQYGPHQTVEILELKNPKEEE